MEHFRRISAACRAGNAAEVLAAVKAARDDGVPWTVIAGALGVTPAVAAERFSDFNVSVETVAAQLDAAEFVPIPRTAEEQMVTSAPRATAQVYEEPLPEIEPAAGRVLCVELPDGSRLERRASDYGSGSSMSSSSRWQTITFRVTDNGALLISCRGENVEAFAPGQWRHACDVSSEYSRPAQNTARHAAPS
jgi:hypothetical protein